MSFVFQVEGSSGNKTLSGPCDSVESTKYTPTGIPAKDSEPGNFPDVEVYQTPEFIAGVAFFLQYNAMLEVVKV
jgi:hypothetical protein